MNFWDILVRIMFVFFMALVMSVFMLLFVEGIRYVLGQLRRCCWEVRKWCRYKRATVMPLTVAAETSDPITSLAVVEVRTAPVSRASYY